MHMGLVDRALLKWVQSAIIHYAGSEPTKVILDSLDLKLGLSDEQLAALSASETAHFNEALALTKFAVPFVDARIPAWHSIPAVVRLDLQAERSDMRHLDDIVDQSRTYFNMTFSQGERFAYASVVNNLRDLYNQYFKRCRIAADRMQRLHGVL